MTHEIDKKQILAYWWLCSWPYMGMWGWWYSFEIRTVGTSSSNTIDCSKNWSGDSSI